MPTLTDIGRIGRDAELRFTTGQNPTPVVALTLACDYGRKVDGKKPTQWVEAVIFGKQAEALAPYLLKGQMMHFTLDDVHIEEFNRADGTPGNKLTGKVIVIKFAGPAPQAQQQTQQSRPQQPRQQPTARPAQSQQGMSGPDYDSFDDDIPFAPLHHLNGA